MAGVVGAWLAALAGLAGLAGAQELSTVAVTARPPADASTEAVFAAMLDEQLAPVPARAIERYEALVHSEIPGGDPALPEALYWLARLRWLQGDLEGARAALDACMGTVAGRARCAALRARVDLDAEAVRALPVVWTFDDDSHAVFHPRPVWDVGSIRIDRTPEGGVLWWTTTVGPREDRLEVPFSAPEPAPSEVRLTVSSALLDAALAVDLVDDLGRSYAVSAVPIRLPRGERRTVTLSLDSASSADGRRLDPRTLDRLVIRDVTAATGAAGLSHIGLHDLRIE